MKIISGVFHPLLMATYLCAILIFSAPELFPNIQSNFNWYFILLVFLLTSLLPGLAIMLLKTFNIVSDLELSSRNERFYPFFIIMICYGICCYLFTVVLNLGHLVVVMILGVTVLIAIMLILTNWIKVSIHSSAVWSGIGFLTAFSIFLGIDFGILFYLSIIAAGLTSTSRLYLGYHSPKETWTGISLGFGYSFFLIFFLF